MRRLGGLVAVAITLVVACRDDGGGHPVGPPATTSAAAGTLNTSEASRVVPTITTLMAGAGLDQLNHIEWGVIGEPNRSHGTVVWWAPVTLFNVGPGEVEVLSLTLGPAPRGAGSLVGFFRYNGFKDGKFWPSSTDPVPGFAQPFSLPATIAPIDVVAAQTSERPQDDPNAVRVIIQVRFDGGEKFVAGELSATYRIVGSDDVRRIVLQSEVGVLCTFSGGCFPNDG